MPRYSTSRWRRVRPTQPTPRELLKTTLIRELYFHQLAFWNHKLQELAKINAKDHGYKGDFPIGKPGGVTYKGKTWIRLGLGYLDEPNDTAYSFVLDPESHLVEEMDEIVRELTAIKREKYETERLLAGLLRYGFNKDILEHSLGGTLLDLFDKHLHKIYSETVDEEAVRQLLDRHADIIDHMNERIVLNLITLDAMELPDQEEI